MVLSIISISCPILSFLLFVWTMSFGYYSELNELVMDVIFYFIMFSFILGILSSIAGFICLFKYDKKNTILFAFDYWTFAQYLLGKIIVFFSAGYYLK